MELNSALSNINFDEAKNLDLDKGTLLIYYKRYRPFFIPVFVIIISIFALFMFVMPQINQYLAAQEQFNIENKKLAVLKNNLKFLSTMDEDKTKSQLESLTKVLPTGKDFYGIITAISQVASKTGVSVGDYSFAVGNIVKVGNFTANTPTIKIDMNLTGNYNAFMNFMTELYQAAPIAEVTSIQTTASTATVSINFYFKPFPPENISDEKPVSAISGESQAILDKVLTWNNVMQQQMLAIPQSIINNASDSAVISTQPEQALNPNPFE